MWKGSQDVLLLVLVPHDARKKFRARMAPPFTLQLAYVTGQLDRRQIEVRHQSCCTHDCYLVENDVPPTRGDIPTTDQPSTDDTKVICCLP